MNYNVMFLSILTYIDGEENVRFESPVAYDPRKKHTKQKLIDTFEDIARQHFNYYSDWEVENDLTFVDNTEQQNRWLVENIYVFNKDNLKVIKSCNVYNEDSEDSFNYQIIEMTPLNIKDEGSDLNVFSGLRKDNDIGTQCRGYHQMEKLFKIKDYLWATKYTTLPSYDYDGRNEISDIIRTVSKSLFALLYEEKVHFKEEAANFACSVYPDYNYEERQSWLREDFRSRTKDWREITKDRNSAIRFINFSGIASVEDDNGFYFSESLIKIPIISSYLEETGDEQKCGEQ